MAVTPLLSLPLSFMDKRAYLFLFHPFITYNLCVIIIGHSILLCYHSHESNLEAALNVWSELEYTTLPLLLSLTEPVSVVFIVVR